MSAQPLPNDDSEPFYIQDPVSWNAACEATPPIDIPPSTTDVRSQYHSEPEEAILLFYRTRLHQLCVVQQDLTIAVRVLTVFGFRDAWQALDPPARREYMLQGHVRLAIYNRGDSSRGYCSDVTLDDLERGGGAGFLELLDVYFPDEGPDETPIPRSFPRPGMGPVPGADPAVNAFRALLVASRDDYLCWFVLFTIHACFDLPRPKPTLRAKIPMKGRLDPEIRQAATEILGAATAKEVSRHANAWFNRGVKSCETCMKVELEPSFVEPEPPSLDGEPDPPLMPCNPRFKQCKPCTDLDRRVYYCSKKCQKDDWRRHKPICGKKLTLETAMSTAL